MSFSVDDLVSSLSSSHIGQEALDLAALQAQLAETLFGCPQQDQHQHQHAYQHQAQRGMQVQIPSTARHTQPCNTPLARTPSSSVGASGGYYMDARRGSASSSAGGSGNGGAHAYADDMEEDERMVEELLMPSPGPFCHGAQPSSSFSSLSSSAFQPPTSPPQPSYAYPDAPSSPSFSSNPHAHANPAAAAASLFTTTDPFYIAQLQASQAAFSSNNNNNNNNAGFASSGRLAQSSPFAVQHAQYSPQYHNQMQYHAQSWEGVSYKPCAAAF